MGRTTKRLAILLLSAAPFAAAPALAQSQPGSGFNTFAPIQCAAASDLCAWKRIPGAGPIRRAPRVVRPPKSPNRSPN